MQKHPEKAVAIVDAALAERREQAERRQAARTARAERRRRVLALFALDALSTACPPIAALVVALFIEQQLAAHVTGAERIAYVVLAGVLALVAVDRTLTIHGDDAYRRLYGRVHGPRTWSCGECGMRVTAHDRTPADEDTLARYVGDPAAHGCTGPVER